MKQQKTQNEKKNTDKNEFQLLSKNPTTGDQNNDWVKMREGMQEKNHTYVITRDPLNAELFTLIHFAPDLSPVRQRMLYASSRATIKAQLGAANFAEDYHISKADECDVKRLIDQRTLHQKVEFRSYEEILKAETVNFFLQFLFFLFFFFKCLVLKKMR